ncbi:secreted RxLR effector protein 161-like [Salvia splendens]|uniref:secreted RxLR effector protein 161-like n=1 Tax=Salvia splendens TaxID=180675 RepID=UPI001C280C85|nr:secreted RxLR effector protein 161-like [Salvia splendens]
METTKSTAIPIAQYFRLSMEQAPKSKEEMLEMQSISYANIVGSVIWILRYVKRVGDLGILFKSSSYNGEDALVGFCSSDFAGNVDTQKSQSGYIFIMYGAAVSWKLSMQNVVALSMTEAEYIALTSAVKESFWLRDITTDRDGTRLQNKQMILVFDEPSILDEKAKA